MAYRKPRVAYYVGHNREKFGSHPAGELFSMSVSERPSEELQGADYRYTSGPYRTMKEAREHGGIGKGKLLKGKLLAQFSAPRVRKNSSVRRVAVRNPATRPTPARCLIAAIDTRTGVLCFFDGRALQDSPAKAVTYTASRIAEDVVKTLKHPKGLTYVIAPAHWTKEHLLERLTGTKKNPASRAEISRAAKGLRRFTGHRVKKVRTYKRPTGGVGYELGPISDITYIATRDRETAKYHHPFAPKSRPSLVATSDGTALEIVGGRFRVTARGIVDL